MPPTFLPGWHKKEEVTKMTFTQLGETDMMVSPVGLGGSLFGGVYPDKGDLQELFEVCFTYNVVNDLQDAPL